jgi:hypothetical protein
MSLARQGVSFLLVGLGLVTADWAVFVVLTALGTPASVANILGRVTGALLGFWAMVASPSVRPVRHGSVPTGFCVSWFRGCR